jgi:hypothetical protein
MTEVTTKPVSDVCFGKDGFLKSLMDSLQESVPILTLQWGDDGIVARDVNTKTGVKTEVFVRKSGCVFYDNDGMSFSRVSTSALQKFLNDIDKTSHIRWTRERGSSTHNFVYFFQKTSLKSQNLPFEGIPLEPEEVPRPLSTSLTFKTKECSHVLVISSAAFRQAMEHMGVFNVQTTFITIKGTNAYAYAYDVPGIGTIKFGGHLRKTKNNDGSTIPEEQKTAASFAFSTRYLKDTNKILALGKNLVLGLNTKSKYLVMGIETKQEEAIIRRQIPSQTGIALPNFNATGCFDDEDLDDCFSA